MNNYQDEACEEPRPERSEYEEQSAPTPPLASAIRDTRIQQLNKGYVVHVGCHTFAFSTKEEMIYSLLKYINEPGKTEQEWFAGKLFK